MNWLERTELMLGEEQLATLKESNVLIVGLGGVGAYAAEQLCRSGIGRMTIVDGDIVEHSNRNRQLPALISNQGRPKAEVMAERFKDINPNIQLTVVNDFLKDKGMIEVLESEKFDYVVDAIDTLSPKVFLIYHSVKMSIPIVSSMGAGGKKDPMLVQTSDIKKSHNCKLARQIRKRLNKLGVNSGVTVVFSPEEVAKDCVREEESQNKKSTVGTISYMPPLFGCHVAASVIKGLLS